MLCLGFELVRRWPPPALSSVFICVISFSDISRGSDGLPFGVPSTIAFSLVMGGADDVGETLASGDAPWYELEFFRMPVQWSTNAAKKTDDRISAPLGLLGASGGECLAGSLCAIVFIVFDALIYCRCRSCGNKSHSQIYLDFHMQETSHHPRPTNNAGTMQARYCATYIHAASL